jgi:hypothetical protein
MDEAGGVSRTSSGGTPAPAAGVNPTVAAGAAIEPACFSLIVYYFLSIESIT